MLTRLDLSTLQHIGEHRSHDSERTSSEEPTEEPRDENRLNILTGGDCDAENGEAKGRYDQRVSASVELRHRRPDDWSKCKAQNVQTYAKGTDFCRDIELPCDRANGRREDRASERSCQGDESQRHRYGQLLSQRPILRMQRIVWTIELDYVLISLGQHGWVFFACAESWQRFLRLPGCGAAP